MSISRPLQGHPRDDLRDWQAFFLFFPAGNSTLLCSHGSPLEEWAVGPASNPTILGSIPRSQGPECRRGAKFQRHFPPHSELCFRLRGNWSVDRFSTVEHHATATRRPEFLILNWELAALKCTQEATAWSFYLKTVATRHRRSAQAY